MQAIGVHPDVIVVRSAFWQTTCTVVHRGEECFAIDSPVLPDELDALPAILGQAGWGLSGLLCTHGDWDHLLGRLAFPDAALGCAETTAARLRGDPGDAQRKMRAFDEENYVERPRPLSLGQVQALPAPGSVEIGDAELEIVPADGHTEDGMAIRVPWAEVLVCGDYLSPVEIPWISADGSASAYLATLDRLEPLVGRVEHVVPGHGPVIGDERALAILREDRAYLHALVEQGADAPLPLARRTGAQRKIHAENVGRVA